MQISFYPKYIPSFTSKKSEIRKADDIQRKTRTAFPFFSPKYADDYYKSCSSVYKSQSSEKYFKHWDNVNILDKKASALCAIRENRHEELFGRNNFANKVIQTISDIKKYGLANCEEASTLTMASLVANGFPNTFKCSLKLDTSVIEKETGEVKFSIRDSLDHAFVVSTMDKNPLNQKNFYVVDSWFGFADSISGAKSRYTALMDKDKFKKSRQKAINQFIQKYKPKYETAHKSFNMDNFEVRQAICYEEKESSSPKDTANIKKLYEEKYPQLILNQEETQPCK